MIHFPRASTPPRPARPRTRPRRRSPSAHHHRRVAARRPPVPSTTVAPVSAKAGTGRSPGEAKAVVTATFQRAVRLPHQHPLRDPALRCRPAPPGSGRRRTRRPARAAPPRSGWRPGCPARSRGRPPRAPRTPTAPRPGRCAPAAGSAGSGSGRRAVPPVDGGDVGAEGRQRGHRVGGPRGRRVGARGGEVGAARRAGGERGGEQQGICDPNGARPRHPVPALRSRASSCWACSSPSCSCLTAGVMLGKVVHHHRFRPRGPAGPAGASLRRPRPGGPLRRAADRTHRARDSGLGPARRRWRGRRLPGAGEPEDRRLRAGLPAAARPAPRARCRPGLRALRPRGPPTC
jgi:hypothetical protein